MKIACLIAAGVLVSMAASPVCAEWVQLDNFFYGPGSFDAGVGNDWQEVQAGVGAGQSYIWCEGTGANYNEYLVQYPGDTAATLGFYLPLGSHAIGEGNSGTLFFRLRLAESTAARFHIGLTKEITAAAGNWTDYSTILNQEGAIASSSGDMKVYDGGYEVVDQQPESNVWYNFWVVADDNSDLYQVYRTTGDTAATAGDKLSYSGDSDFAFRNTTANPLSSVMIKYNYYSGKPPTHFDQIAIDNSGLNLTIPSFSAEEGSVFYTQSFWRAVGDAGDTTISHGWKAYALSNDTVVLDFSEDGTAGLPVDGSGNQVLAISDKAGAVLDKGYMFYAPKIENPDNMTGPAFMHTDDGEVTGSTDVANITRVNFWIKNIEATATTRFAMKVGGQWYVETTGHTESNDTWDLITLTEFSGIWSVLNFDPDSDILSIGDAVGGDLSGTVTALGFYMAPGANGNHVRVDELLVLYEPPPTYTGMILLFQ